VTAVQFDVEDDKIVFSCDMTALREFAGALLDSGVRDALVLPQPSIRACRCSLTLNCPQLSASLSVEPWDLMPAVSLPVLLVPNPAHDRSAPQSRGWWGSRRYYATISTTSRPRTISRLPFKRTERRTREDSCSSFGRCRTSAPGSVSATCFHTSVLLDLPS
jgi:hypothetical protein